MTRSKIVDLIEKMYGHHYTAQTMSYITKLFTEDVTASNGLELHDRYAVIYMDATYIPLTRKTVAKEAILSNENLLTFWDFPVAIKVSNRPNASWKHTERTVGRLK